MLEAFFLIVKIFIPLYLAYPPKFSGLQRILLIKGQSLLPKLFQKDGLFIIWEYKSFRSKVRDFSLKWWPVSVDVVYIVGCPVDWFSFKSYPFLVVRPASIINFLACCVNHFELGWCCRLFCTPTWVMLDFGSSCSAFKHSSALPV